MHPCKYKRTNLERQLEAVKPYMTDEKYIYSDKVSGKDIERDGFQSMLKAMRKGDIKAYEARK